MKSKEIVNPPNAPAAIGPYSPAVRSGDWLFCSGQIPVDPETGELVSGGIKEQTRRVLENIGLVLNSQGLDYQTIIKTTVFLSSMKDFPEMNSVYGEFLATSLPARSTIEVSALPKGALVEIEVIAVLPKD